MMTLALRNLLRHRRRSIIILATIGFGVIALLLVGGFMEWAFWGMREGTIHSRLGHIQITRPGYFETGSADPFAYLLPEGQENHLDLGSIEGVVVVSPRLDLSGLISHGDVSIGFVGEGVDPVKDAVLSEHLIITSGERLSTDEPRGMLLGGGLAATLGVSVGDKVVLLVNTGSGGLNAVEGRVRGIFQSASKAFDDMALRLPLTTARDLLRVSGAHKWVILLDNTEDTDRLLQQLRGKYLKKSADVQFTPWYELADFYNKMVKLFSRQFDAIRLIVAMIIVLGISNTLIMSVLERTGEIGTLLALGFRRRRIIQLFYTEGIYLGIIGGGFGVGAGIMLAKVISKIGIPMPSPPGMEVGFTGSIMLTWPLVAGAMALAMSTALLGSLYPAWKASRLEIVDALRHNH